MKTRKDTHSLKAYSKIIQRLIYHKLTVELQILYNEASAYYNRVITKKWNINHQLLPPTNHQRNVAEQAILTFKAYFISIFSSVDHDFPIHLWDL